jgi:hypothetical protein
MSSRCLILASFLAVAGISVADAAPKKKPPPAAAKAVEVPRTNEKAVSELLEPWRWGMTTEEVLGALQAQLTERAAPEVARISDVYEQQRIRKRIKANVDAVRRNVIKFDGQRTGWDVSIIQGEFLHKNDESMMLYREADPATGREQQRFFFFVGGKLWKQFIAFDMEPYKGKTFSDFRGAMEARYGQGEPIIRTDREGKQKVVAVAWKAGNTYLRAIDLMQFYSNFCLAFSEQSVEERMQAERLARAPRTPPPRAVVTTPGNDPIHDPNADIIDRITGPPR